MRSYKALIAQLLCVMVVSAGTAVNCNANIVGPYTADANTLHLWHMDQSTVPVLDSVPTGGTNLTSLQNLATLGNASFPGFGSALNAYGQGPTVAGACYLAPQTLPNDNTSFTYAGPDGAFTYEAIVQITYNPMQNLGTGGTGRNQALTILAAEGNSNPLRIFQFRIDPIGYVPGGNSGFTSQLTEPALEFINLHQGSVQQIVVPLTTNIFNSPDAIVQNGWYHVAVTFNGQPGTPLNFYWTRMDSNRTSASLVGSVNMTSSLSSGATPNFVVGNTGRNPGGNSANPVNANFLGLIDEVRMSKVALAPGQMMFSAPTITIDTDVTNQVTVLGQTVNFAVSASGVPPLRYQWRHEFTNIIGATQAVYTIPAVSLADVGNYDVVITNNYTAITSSIGVLSLRTPIDLTWAGQGWPWDVSNFAWYDSGMNLTVYTEGDNVTFDSVGAGWTPVTLGSPVYPSSVTVNSDTDYTFTSSTGGGIYGKTGLTKTGTGNLILDLNNSYAGPTIIQSGTIQVGAVGAQGSLGSGSVTNNGGLIFNRTGSLTVNNNIAGSGGITNICSGNIILSGNNTFSGAVVVSEPNTNGAITLASPQALGEATDVVLTAHNGGGGLTGARLALAGGITIPANRTLWMLKTTTQPDLRCNLYTVSGTNSWNGPIILGLGDGITAFAADAVNAELDVNGPISSSTFPNKLILRGTGGQGFVRGEIDMPAGQVNKTDNSTWTISSTSNSWVSTDIAAGTLRMGGNNVFPASAFVNFTAGANLDLGGYNQQIAGLNGTNAAFIVGSSSTTSDSTLAINATFPSTNWGVIQDSLSGGTRKVGLTLLGGSLTLTNINTYSGDTTISAGTLYLLGPGSIANSSSIYIGNGATLDLSGRADAGLTLSAAQTLKGDGAFSVVGNLTNNGTLELKVNKSGSTLTSDSIHGLSQVAFGGTLKIDLSGDPLVGGESFPLFAAAGYSGQFTAIVPASPGPGLAWSRSTLATGTLRVISLPVATSVTQTTTNITYSGSNGPALGAYVIVTTTGDPSTPRDLWIPVITNTFGADGSFSFTIPIQQNVTRRLFTMRIP